MPLFFDTYQLQVSQNHEQLNVDNENFQQEIGFKQEISMMSDLIIL